MSYYPLFVSLSGKDILVVGAGSVGRRKIAALLEAGPRSVMVVDPALPGPDDAQLADLMRLGPLECHARAFLPEDVQGKILVFAATCNRAVNADVAEACAAHGILCNSADAPEEGDFIVPAHFTKSELSIAVSTGGHSPALARVLREDLEAFVGTRYTRLLAVLGHLRPLLLELGLPTRENTALFRTLARSPLAGQLEAENLAAAEATLTEILPEPLRARVRELLHGY